MNGGSSHRSQHARGNFFRFQHGHPNKLEPFADRAAVGIFCSERVDIVCQHNVPVG